MTASNRPEWLFERERPMGGARATAWRDTLEGGQNFSPEARIAREAIQNSVDATLPNEKTEIVVRNKTLSPVEMASVRDALALDSADSPVARPSALLGLSDDNPFQRIARGAKGGVRTTVIEDWNTCGLGYDADDGKDRFEELCLYLGQDSANVDGKRGGSYGFGKTVYEQASDDCHTFIVYSVFEPSEQTGGHYSRLFVCSHFLGHTFSEDKTRDSRGGGVINTQAGLGMEYACKSPKNATRLRTKTPPNSPSGWGSKSASAMNGELQ